MSMYMCVSTLYPYACPQHSVLQEHSITQQSNAFPSQLGSTIQPCFSFRVREPGPMAGRLRLQHGSDDAAQWVLDKEAHATHSHSMGLASPQGLNNCAHAL